jgi:hypothetical protein
MDSRWLLFLHIGAVLALMLAHGVHVTASWKKRWEADPTRQLALFDPLTDARWLRLGMGAVIGSGLLSVWALDIWTQRWPWLSLAVLVLLWLLMYRWGGAYYNATEMTAEALLAAQGTDNAAAARRAFDQARQSWLVPAMTVLGLGALAFILWLMVFRPG